jgi:16S rRNA (cytosine1402-N4)-methyltransferase
MQLDQGEKGFSFQKEGPLDMRMDPTTELTAEEIVNKWDAKELGAVLRDFGEEPRWKRAVEAIVKERRRKPIKTTQHLAELMLTSLGSRTRGKLHPATLIFQGLRICVNNELDVLKKGLSKALDFLAPGGRMGVISFHRLEDRIVKEVFRAVSKPLKRQMGEEAVRSPLFRLLTKKPLTPIPGEIRKNPRSRSAKMRFIEKVEPL